MPLSILSPTNLELNLIDLDVIMGLSLGQKPLVESEGKVRRFSKRTQISGKEKTNSNTPDVPKPVLLCTWSSVCAHIAVLISRFWDFHQ